MTAIAGALGSVIGYMGSEVAERDIFERLLWPQRYYNHFNLRIFVVQTLLMPTGGPLHAAALRTLDSFRENRLYHGPRIGHMLGTAFLPDTGKTYHCGNHSGQGPSKSVRNGFWFEVLRHARPQPSSVTVAGRATQFIYRLDLTQSDSKRAIEEKHAHIGREILTWQCFAGVIASELTAVGLAVFVGMYEKVYWLATYLLLPLCLKLVSLLVTVRRQGVLTKSENGSLTISDKSTLATRPDVEAFEITDSNVGFMLIAGRASTVQQFFRHYGHPLRDKGYGNRAREVCCIALVYCFVAYFPIGLLGLLWMPERVQYVWLGYQMYNVLAMHFVRLFGLSGSGRTEETIAHSLQEGKAVLLTGGADEGVLAELSVTSAGSVDEGRVEMARLIALVRKQSDLEKLESIPVSIKQNLEPLREDVVDARTES